MEYLTSLNDAQRNAVEQLDGPLLVLAGAGTGKTRVLTTRLAHMLNLYKAMPGEILAVTFTNKAAMEMKERVSSLMGGQPVEGWWLGTFHALAGRMLRQHADLVGLSSNYTIIDPDDAQRLVKQLMMDMGVDIKKHLPKIGIAMIDRWKDRALTPDKVTAEEASDFADGKAVDIYRAYQSRLKTLNACDFGDLLLHMITILQGNPEVLDKYHSRFRYIMVDEYQDTNVAQYLWLRLLAQKSGNICVVGDDDQSIYGWRGAQVENILRFEKDFEGAKTVRLENNYRSTQNILTAADGVIDHNVNRLGKTLKSTKGEGDKIIVHGLWDGAAEARWVGEEIEQLQRKGIKNSEIAVLVRTGFQMREFEERFITLNIPYRIVGGPRFYERMEIRDALGYFRVTAQPHDDLALERIINTPKRGLGNATIQKLYDHARFTGISLYDAILHLCDSDELKPKQRATLSDLMQQFEGWRSMIESTPHAELAAQILDDSGYLQMWKDDKSVEAQGRVENLNELISAMADFVSFEQFLEHVALVMEAQENTSHDKVTIMTLHGAKGLEFDCVFLPGWEEGLFPSQRAMDENGLKGLEEERRLAYVGLTRAREQAFITNTANRRTYGQWVNNIPSRFIEELPDDVIDKSSDIEVRSSHFMDSSPHLSSSGLSRGSSGFQKDSPNKSGNDSDNKIRIGARVRHSAFGEGTILVIDGNKLDVVFDSKGRKRILESFVEAV